MGFFDDLNSMISDVSSISGELKQSTEEVLGSITDSTQDLASVKDEFTLDEPSSTDTTKSQ